MIPPQILAQVLKCPKGHFSYELASLTREAKSILNACKAAKTDNSESSIIRILSFIEILIIK